MTLTEREAKTKSCPFARVTHYNASINRTASGAAHDGAKCLTTGCTTWVPLAQTKARRYRANDTNDAICRWVRDNPIPLISHIRSTEEDRILGEHMGKAIRFAESLPASDPPHIEGLDNSQWQWTAGWDAEEHRPFAHWHYPPEPRGRCGLVNALNMEG